MRIKILQFQVIERHVLRDSYGIKIWKYLFGSPEPDVYHFDVKMKVDTEYVARCRPLAEKDVISLPNGVRLIVWSVDRFGIVQAKTMRFIDQNLRGYIPMYLDLVYDRQHGHVNDRAR